MTSQKPDQPAPEQTRTKKLEFALQDIGFTLATDAKTLAELEEMQGEAIKAAQQSRKFAWR